VILPRLNPQGFTRSAEGHIASACPTQCAGRRGIVIMGMRQIAASADGIVRTTDKDLNIPVSWRHSMTGNLWNIPATKSSVTSRSRS
jgi:hypothetical protein